MAIGHFFEFSQRLPLAALPGGKRCKVRPPAGFHPFRRSIRRSRNEDKGLRPLGNPRFFDSMKSACPRFAEAGALRFRRRARRYSCPPPFGVNRSSSPQSGQ